ncbi:MAG TPA: hypothetical protein VMV92_33910 [Streptosporangiaceae bacterium]|nr:hypothetical protein [Streptosporangiaceae bacterium]
MSRTTEAVTSQDAGKPAGRGHGSGPLERVTVNLTARSSRALEVATELTGETKTDTINRALQIYAFLEQVCAGGGSIYTRESAGAELERIKIF